MKRARGDEQNVVGLDHSILGRNRRTFHQWQQISLHTLTRDIGATGLAAFGDFIKLVDEHNAVLLSLNNGLRFQFFLVDKL